MFPLYPFPELSIKSNLFYCSLSNCQAIKANKANIIWHIKEKHSSALNKEKDLSSYYSLINGQSLVSTRLFFPIVEKEKLREKVIGEDTNKEEEERKTDLLPLFISMPKVEIHVHIEGTMTAQTVWQLAIKNNVILPAKSLEEWRKVYEFKNFNHFLKY